MTKPLEHAVETVRTLAPEMQDEIAILLLQLAGEEQPCVRLSATEAASFKKSLDQASRRDYATDEQVRSVWAKYGL